MNGWPIEHKILLGPVTSKLPQKHPILKGGPAQGKKFHRAKWFSPRDFSSRKPSRNEVLGHFLKTENLLGKVLLAKYV